MKKEENEKVYANQLVLKTDLEELRRSLIAEFRSIVKELSVQKQKQWIKSAEVKKLLNVSHGKLQTMRNSGVISFTKIGGTLYYDADDINKMFEKYKMKQNEKCT